MGLSASYLNKTTNSSVLNGDVFGSIVAVSGDGQTMAAAGYYNIASDNSSNKAIRIFNKSGDTWSLSSSIIDLSSSDYESEYALDLSHNGTVLVVSLKRDFDNNSQPYSKVYIYKLISGSWVQFQMLEDMSDSSVFGSVWQDKSISSVRISGDASVIAIAQPLKVSGSNVAAGTVALYSVQSNGSYSFVRALSGSSSENSLFGSSIDLSIKGEYLAVGSMGYSDSVSIYGAVYHYDLSSMASSEPTPVITTAIDASSGHYFGHEVSISGDGLTIAVGSVSSDDNFSDGKSSVTILRKSLETGLISVEANLLQSDASSAEYTGHSLSLSLDGDFLAAGVWEGSEVDDVETGAVYLFERQNGSWSQSQRIVSPEADYASYFGHFVHILPEPDSMVITAPHNNLSNPALNEGALFNYSLSATVTADVFAPIVIGSRDLYAFSSDSVSVSFLWQKAYDNVDEEVDLEYEVRYSSSNNISTISDFESNGAIAVSYASDISSATVSGLDPSTTYYFNVAVKDLSGNKHLYNSGSFLTKADTTAPVVGNSGIISVVEASQSSISISWTKAQDNYNTQDQLRYEVTMSEQDNISELKEIKNGLVVMAYTADVDSFTVTKLQPGTDYYFNVVVMDRFGNRSIYSSVSASTTADISGPTPGAAGIILFDGVGQQEFRVSWTRASDDSTHYEDLKYALYQSSSANLSTVSDIEANGEMVTTFEYDMTSMFMTDLVPGTTYYYNVIVKDEQENKSCYAMANVTTVADSAAPVPGNSGYIVPDSATISSVDLSWVKAEDDISSQETIKYAVYKSLSSSMTTVNQIEANGTLVQDYVSDMSSISVTGLNADSVYYFNVIAKDEAGNKVAYEMARASTTVDTTVPSPGNSGIVSVSLATASSMQVTWTKGTDNVTDAGYLTYGVYYSTSDNISSVQDAEANGTLASAFVKNSSFLIVRNLEPETTYYFNVVIKDSAGNKSSYVSTSGTTLADIEAPVPGGSGTITASAVGLTSMILSWNRATDNASNPPNLLYQVFMSTSDNISTVVAAEANGTIIRSYNSSTYHNVTGLESGEVYYFNVIVKDAKGNKSIYATKSQETLNDIIEIPDTPVSVGEAVVIESSKDLIKSLPYVSSHPTLSKPRNWEKIHMIYKSNTSSKRVVVTIKDFSSMVGTFTAEDSEIFYIHKIIVEDANNNFVPVPATMLDKAEEWYIGVN